MALIMIFVGSFVGVIVASIQLLFQDASFWHAVSTYLVFSFGFPALTGVLAWGLYGLRTPAQDQDDIGWRNA